MKKIIFAILLFVPLINTFSQIDTTRKEFFPLHIGDVWQFINENNKLATERVVGDTIIGGEKYFLLIHSLKTAGGGVMRVDSLLRVVNDGYGSDSPIYRLDEKDGTVWPIVQTFWGLPTRQPLVRLNGITTSSVFGVQREIMHFDFGGTPAPPYDTLWGFGALLAKGIGVIREQYYETDYFNLQGAIIDGIQYGTIVSVGEISPSVPTQVMLYQNYPNPFNPTTNINYQLSTVSHVYLKIFDMLGREVATLMDGMKDEGYLTATFDGSHLSSGVYFVHFTATPQNGSHSFTKTMKMLMVK